VAEPEQRRGDVLDWDRAVQVRVFLTSFPQSRSAPNVLADVPNRPYNLPTRYRALFAQFEHILARHGGRPHWAKAHHLDAQAVRRLYPDFGKFLKVVREVSRFLFLARRERGLERVSDKIPIPMIFGANLPIKEKDRSLIKPSPGRPDRHIPE